MAQILIVDDDDRLRESFVKLVRDEGHEVLQAASGESGLKVVREKQPDLVVMDVRMPGMDGLEAFRRMRSADPGVQAIIMTAYGDTSTAIKATKAGAFDYILKPFDIPEVLALMEQALEAARFAREQVVLDPEQGHDHEMEALIGSSRPMQEVYKAIGRVAPTDALVLIRGESGTGKELVARAVFQHSDRAGKPFMVINCVAIPDTLLESELFGYEKGAFTGADNRRIGKIEIANRGTIFLDEIGDMPLGVQAKILRLLQEKTIERLGGRKPIPVDVRVMAATNRDLEQAVADGTFREDLYYRLKVVSLELPPLRDRHQDIPALAEYFLARFSKEMDTPNPGMDTQAVKALKVHNWPGNVRELSNVLQKALIFNRGGILGADDVRRAFGRDSESASGSSHGEDAVLEMVRKAFAKDHQGKTFERLMDEFGRIIVREALEITGGNRTKAARLLGVSRPTLISRIDRYGLSMKTTVV